MIYCFDLDGTICSITKNNNYPEAVPMQDVVDKVNELYEDNKILIFTARGASSGIDWRDFTAKQLDDWGVKHHELIMGQKPSFDLMIDDKAINAEVWRKQNTKRISGVVAGSFDVIHPGYIRLLKDAKKHCNYLTVCLHDNPAIENDNKIPPVLSVEERKEVLSSIKYVDEIFIYNTELELESILEENKFDVRIIGSDYLGRKITGEKHTSKIVFHDRNHDWSTTKYKTKIYDNYKSFTMRNK
jgi:glycerol-3-phosphate cytidylyltransferase